MGGIFISGNLATGRKNGGFLPLKKFLLVVVETVVVVVVFVVVAVDVSRPKLIEDEGPLMDSGVTKVTTTSSPSP